MSGWILDVPAAGYHADTLNHELDDAPRFSKSIGHLLLTKSPRHAWAAHPKLNPNWKPSDEAKFDVGTAAHAMLLEGDESLIAVVDAKDWKTKAAQSERDEARAAGFTPLLRHVYDEAREMIAAARAQLDLVDPTLFAAGRPERTLAFAIDGVACKARCDWLDDSLARIVDYKTTSGSAAPEVWTTNRLYDIGADLQAVLYLRGLDEAAADGGQRRFVFVVQETAAPYALSVIELGPDVVALAQAKLEFALATWKRCLATGEWPAYPTEIVRAKLPAWQENRWYEREDRGLEVAA